MDDFERQVIESMASVKSELLSLRESFVSFKLEVRADLESRQKRSHELANLISAKSDEMSEYRRQIDVIIAQRPCQEHARDFAEIRNKLDAHISEAERENGWHDKIRSLDTHRQHLIRFGWVYMVGSGIIGGGIVSGAIKLWGGISKILGV